MANYYATTRSNYFRVKDEAAFIAWCASHHLEHWHSPDGFAIASTSDNGWPCSTFDVHTDEEIEFDLAAELANHLRSTDVAVLLEVGYDKLRYLVGEAIAVDCRGEAVHLSLDELYGHAAMMRFPGKRIGKACY